MAPNQSAITLTAKQYRQFKKIQQKFNVSDKFLCHNMHNIKKFLLYGGSPHAILRRYAVRKRSSNRVYIQYFRLRRLVFEPKNLKMIKLRKRNVKQWSGRMVNYLKSIGRTVEYEEMEIYNVSEPPSNLAAEEVSKKLKEQLELLKTGKRIVSLIRDTTKDLETSVPVKADCDSMTVDKHQPTEIHLNGTSSPDNLVDCLTIKENNTVCIQTPLVDKILSPNVAKDEDTQIIQKPKFSLDVLKNGNFLDMLINKVRVKNFAKEANFNRRLSTDKEITVSQNQDEKSNLDTATDSGEDFLGFDDSEYQPGMLLTPLVPGCSKSNTTKAAFVSESLNEYMRRNHLHESKEEPQTEVKEKSQTVELEGLVTPNSVPPFMDMPAVPESLQKLRTVAERRQYLQKFSKNHKMVIINNEANIYRELQRKIRKQKVKGAAMLMLQAPSTYMPFTRKGWQAASYIATDNNKYYFQTINVDGEVIKLPGVLGNNETRDKPSYSSKVVSISDNHSMCPANCLDAKICQEFKIIKTINKKILNKFPLPSVFRPCPLSQKALQKPLDDDTAALLLAGGSMAVVSMPSIELEVYPEYGKPLNEIAKRYLQYILPHHDITREWAEFSVSTLQQPQTLREAEQAAAKVIAGRRRSFTFAIPYLHDRNQLLVRRVVDRSEKLDESFEIAQETDTNASICDLSFRANINKLDDVSVDCANMVSEMINTVAISCSENSFIKEDPQYMNFDKNKETIILNSGDIVKTEQLDTKKSDSKCGVLPRKQQRLRLELRRLNATIIDAQNKADKPCSKEECQLGCVCESIAGDIPMREHCGKASCVVECGCKGAIQARITRFETDGRGISNEDAFLLRHKATARLARMEKEFTSTIVLTENETLLINESQRDKKRRCTKAPKRYEDFTDTEDEYLRNSPKKLTTATTVKGSVMSIDTNDSMSSTGSYPQIMELREPCKVRDIDFEKLKHCSVPLRRLPDVSNMVTFCMSHQLYKCFCGAESVDGKPIVLEKEEVNTTISASTTIHTDVLSKAHYSFDKVENPISDVKVSSNKLPIQKEPLRAAELKVPANTTLIDVENIDENIKETLNKRINRGRCLDLDIIYEYFKLTPNICRRALKVPRRCYLRRNRKRAPAILRKIAVEETQETRDKLVRRIQGAVRFYRLELENKRNLEMAQRKPDNETVIEVCDDEDETIKTNMKSSLKRTHEAADNANNSAINEVIPKIKRIEKRSESPRSLLKSRCASPIDSNLSVLMNKATIKSDIQLPRIAACYSLSTTSSPSSSSTAANLISAQSNSVANVINSESPDMSINVNDNVNVTDQHFKEFYNDVVKNMNSLVSKKMQDIDMALQRESKLIPAPNEEILCIIKWTNFLAAYESGFVYIWEVKMKTYSFLAATITNMIPIVCGAIGVVNILGIKVENLPLLARMLLERTHTEATLRLAVVMQGRSHYWLIKGFLRHMVGNACTKPTPSSHPLLTKKINVLCSLLVKQRIKEHQKKLSESAAAGAGATAPTKVKSPPPLVATLPTQITSNQPTQQTLPTVPPLLGKLALPTLQRTYEKQRRPLELNPQKETTIKSNVEFRKVNESDVNELQLPEHNTQDHRWLVLDLHSDFSHIFVPAFKDMISLDRIHNVMTVSREKNKIVKLQFFQDAPYDAFVTPTSQRKIYFGPLKLTTPPPVLVLLQSVDGKMMLREVYQQDHNITVNLLERTTAFWVLFIKGQAHFEIEHENVLSGTKPPSTNNPLVPDVKKVPQNISASNDSDEDDCVIIEDSGTQSTRSPIQQIQDKSEFHNKASEQLRDIKVDKNGLSIPQQQQRINFSIQATSNKILKITPVNSEESLSITDCTIAPNIPLMQLASTSSAKDIGFVPLITNLPAGGILKSVAPTTSAYLIPKMSELPKIENLNNSKANISGTSSTSTFITPQVKLTQTNFLESSALRQAEPCTSIRSPTNSILNNPSKEPSTSSHAVRDDFKLIKLNNTTITSMGDSGNAPSHSISAGKRILNHTNKIGRRTVSPSATQDLTSGAKKRSAAGMVKNINYKTKTGTSIEENSDELNLKSNTPPTNITVKNVNILQKPTIQPHTNGKVFTNSKTANLPSDMKVEVMPKKMPASATATITSDQEINSKISRASLAQEAILKISSHTELNKKFIASDENKITNIKQPQKNLPKAAVDGLILEFKSSEAYKDREKYSMFGYMCAPNLPKFGVKAMNDIYLMKVPKVGILRLVGIDAVNVFLNRHLSLDPNYKQKLPARWKFVPQKRRVPQSQAKEQSRIKPSTVNSADNFKLNTIDIQCLNEKHKNFPKCGIQLKSGQVPSRESSQTDTILIED